MLLLPLILFESLFVGKCFTIDQSFVTNELATELALLVSHLCSEVNLLSCMLLFKLFPESSLFIFEGVLDLEIDTSEQVLFVEAKCFQSFFIGGFRQRVLHLLKFVLFDLEVLLDSISLSVLLVSILG